MTYYLGVDLGTTYTAAAVYENGSARVLELGNRTPTIPSVVFLTDDGTVLTGEAANRRAATDPTRVAREFKRRIGDTTPLLLGGTPYSADALSAMLLRWTHDQVSERQGAAPAGIAVTYPANWGPFKRDLLDQAIRQADLDGVTTITEPEAAVIDYASNERVDPGAIVAVYDLGGGTFDAAVVRKLEHGVEVLGEPEGIERLGGIDFDEAVFAHVRASLGDALSQLDPNDPVALSAMARLRQECVEAKEALSSDSEVSIPVVLPSIATEVRLTRAEFERMITPTLAPTLTAMQRALRSAGVTPDQVNSILLAGGSSRIPLVAQMIGTEMGRPVAVDAHPKHTVALGAAKAAADAAEAPAAAPPVAPVAAAPIVAPTPEPAPAPAPPVEPAAAVPTTEVPAVDPTQVMPAAQPVAQAPPAAAPPASPPPSHGVGASAPTSGGSGGGTRKWFIVGLAAVVLAVVGFVAATQLGGGDDPETIEATDGGGEDSTDGGGVDGDAEDGDVVPEPTPTQTPAPEPTPTQTPIPTPEPTSTPTPIPPTPTPTPDPERLPCPDTGDRCIEIDELSIDGANLVVDWTAFGFVPELPGGFHAHFFSNVFEPAQAGNNAAEFGANSGSWNAIVAQPYVKPLSELPEGTTKFCVTVGMPSHGADNPDLFQCVDLPEA